MSENLNRGTRDFSKYDTMGTAELEEILRLDAELLDGAESDTELIFYVMEVLADRRRNSANAGKTAFEAWESFEHNYMPKEETAKPEKEQRRNLLALWLRRVTAAAAVVALLVCIPVAAQAFSLGDLWDIFAHWAKETFSFVSGEDSEVTEPVEPGEEGFTSLQDALEKSNRDPSVAPTWIPTNYHLEYVNKNVSPTRESYIAFYSNGNNVIKISIQTYLSGDPTKMEINDDLVETYSYSGIDFHIFTNLDSLKAMWITDSYECSIAGNISVDDIKCMIRSIGKDNYE